MINLSVRKTITDTVSFAKSWTRRRGVWTSHGVVAYRIEDATPRVPSKGDAYIVECDSNNEAGDIMFCGGGMKNRRTIVKILTPTELKNAFAGGDYTLNYTK